MTAAITVRPVQPEDYAAWRPLWDGYNAFYGRFGATALPEHITQTTWQRFHDAAEPMFCLVAQDDASGELVLQGRLNGEVSLETGRGHVLVGHLLLGPIRSITRSAASLSLSMTRIEPVCYLSDLFTREAARGRGVGRALIGAVYDSARAAKSSRVYWQTHESNTAGRQLYDKLAKHHGFIVYAQEL